MDLGMDSLLRSLGSTINLLGVMGVFWIMSKIYYNLITAHKRPVYNSVEYNECDIYTEKKEHGR